MSVHLLLPREHDNLFSLFAPLRQNMTPRPQDGGPLAGYVAPGLPLTVGLSGGGRQRPRESAARVMAAGLRPFCPKKK